MSYILVIQMSLTGDIWTTIDTQTGVTPGDPFTYVDEPVEPGELRLYRARYECESDSEIHSDWAYDSARGPYPQGDAATMCNVITSAQTMLGISNPERNTGAYCKAEWGVDFRSHNLQLMRGIAESSANRNAPEETTDEGPALSTVSGPLVMEMKPGGAFERILGTFYNQESADVTTINSVVGPPSVPEHYTKDLKQTFACRPCSLISKEGESAFVYGGIYGNGFSFELDKNATTPILFNFDIVAVEWREYPAATTDDLEELGLDTATYDLLRSLYNTDWVLYVDNVAVPAVRVGASYNRNLQLRAVGDNTMGGTCYYPLKARTSLTITLFWEDKKSLLRFLGEEANATSPLGLLKLSKKSEVKIVFTPTENADNYSNVVEFIVPVAAIRSWVKEIPENGPIMQVLTVQPHQDPNSGRISHKWKFTNGEDFAALTDYGVPVAYVPKKDLTAYYAIPAVVDDTTPPTTTVFKCFAQYSGTTYLPAADDALNGKKVRFFGNVTAALAGVEATILDYVGATRQITLTAALGVAPADNDIFQILSTEKA